MHSIFTDHSECTGKVAGSHPYTTAVRRNKKLPAEAIAGEPLISCPKPSRVEDPSQKSEAMRDGATRYPVRAG